MVCSLFFFVKHKTAYNMRISDWSSDVCSSDRRNTGSTRRSAAAAPTSCATTWAPRTRSKSALRSEAPHPPPELGEVSGGGKPGRETCRAFFLSFPQPSETVAEAGFRSEERRVGKEWGSKCSSRWAPDNTK